jgi:uncharacterized protein (DUF1697 family)
MTVKKLTNQQILEKAIQKAIDGGWGRPYWVIINDYKEFDTAFSQHPFETIIFNHDFAQALWGKGTPKTYENYKDILVPSKYSEKYEAKVRELYNKYLKDFDSDDNWRNHLKQMVIAEDPIKYLGENLG